MNLGRFGRYIKWSGAVMTGVSLLLGFTPIQWEFEKWLHGVPDQYYPELFWLFMALPVSLIVVAGGMVAENLATRSRQL